MSHRVSLPLKNKQTKPQQTKKNPTIIVNEKKLLRIDSVHFRSSLHCIYSDSLLQTVSGRHEDPADRHPGCPSPCPRAWAMRHEMSPGCNSSAEVGLGRYSSFWVPPSPLGCTSLPGIWGVCLGAGSLLCTTWHRVSLGLQVLLG